MIQRRLEGLDGDSIIRPALEAQDPPRSSQQQRSESSLFEGFVHRGAAIEPGQLRAYLYDRIGTVPLMWTIIQYALRHQFEEDRRKLRRIMEAKRERDRMDEVAASKRPRTRQPLQSDLEPRLTPEARTAPASAGIALAPADGNQAGKPGTNPESREAAPRATVEHRVSAATWEGAPPSPGSFEAALSRLVDTGFLDRGEASSLRQIYNSMIQDINSEAPAPIHGFSILLRQGDARKEMITTTQGSECFKNHLYLFLGVAEDCASEAKAPITRSLSDCWAALDNAPDKTLIRAELDRCATPLLEYAWRLFAVYHAGASEEEIAVVKEEFYHRTGYLRYMIPELVTPQ